MSRSGRMTRWSIRGIAVGGVLLYGSALSFGQTPQGPATPLAPAEAAAAVARAEMLSTAQQTLNGLYSGLSQTARAEVVTNTRRVLNEAVRRMLVERAVVEPLTTSTQAANQHQITVVADKGEVNGRARFYVPFGPGVDGQLTLTSPLTGGQTTFATADGLGANASINGSIKWTVWTKEVKLAAAAFQQLNSILTGTSMAQAVTDGEEGLVALELLRRAAATSGSPGVFATAATATGNPEVGRLLASPSLVATPERFYAAVVQEVPALTSTTWAGYVTVGGDANRHSVEYLSEDSFETKAFDRTTGMFTLSGGVSRMGTFTKTAAVSTDEAADTYKKPLFYAGGSFRGGNSVKVGDPQKICRPIGSGSASECVEAPVGIPSPASSVSWVGEIRLWSWGAMQSIGFNPRFTYTRLSPDTGDRRTVRTIEAPIYFMHQVDDVNVPDVSFGADLVGGVSVGWRQSRTGAKTTEGAFVTLFLTKVFGIP